MRKCILGALLVLSVATLATAQASESGVADVMGPHSNGGRGCAACHQPHSDVLSNRLVEAAPLWGQDVKLPYGPDVVFSHAGNTIDVVPASVALDSGEIDGILFCMSCHDGNVAPLDMLTAQIYDQRIGQITNPAYGAKWIATLMGKDTTAAGFIQDPHPIGVTAVIPGNSWGLIFENGQFSIKPGSGYEQFVHNYGWPALAPGKRRSFYGVNHAGQAYVTCTTCHDQHVMSMFTSNSNTPIAGDSNGRTFTKLFFLSGPYNPNTVITDGRTALSSTQFCRQCHFNFSNEGNNVYTVKTTFQ